MNDEPWRIVVTAPAARDLGRLPEKAIGAVVGSLEAIGANPHRVGKALRFELAGRWVARRGPYRVIYRIDEVDRCVVIIAIGHRTDVYRSR